MDDWFEFNHVPEEERITIAIDTLTHFASYFYGVLKQMQDAHGMPDLNWEEMKESLHREFGHDDAKVDEMFLIVDTNPQPRRWIKSTYNKLANNSCPNVEEAKCVLVLGAKDQEESSKPSQDASSKDEQVSRTKLFEEGGYDVGPESTKTNHALFMEPVTLHGEDKGPASLGCGQDPTQTFSPTEFSTFRRTPEEVSAQKKLKINLENSEINLDEFLAHLESPSKKNQPIISSHEGDMKLTSQLFSKPPVSDIWPLIWMKRSNQKELSYKPTWYRILIQFRRFEKWNHTKPILYEGVIDFPNQPNSKSAGLDLPDLFAYLRADDGEFGYKLNSFVILTHQGESEAWNHIIPNFNEGVMIFTNKCDLHLPYFEGKRFGGNRAYVWRPGELLHHGEDHMILFKCFLDPWIRRIQSIHGFVLKLSRYKILGSDGFKKKSNFF